VKIIFKNNSVSGIERKYQKRSFILAIPGKGHGGTKGTGEVTVDVPDDLAEEIHGWLEKNHPYVVMTLADEEVVEEVVEPPVVEPPVVEPPVVEPPVVEPPVVEPPVVEPPVEAKAAAKVETKGNKGKGNK
jgi:hypothetical protein